VIVLKLALDYADLIWQKSARDPEFASNLSAFARYYTTTAAMARAKAAENAIVIIVGPQLLLTEDWAKTQNIRSTTNDCITIDDAMRLELKARADSRLFYHSIAEVFWDHCQGNTFVESVLVRGVHLTQLGTKFLASSLVETIYNALSCVVFNDLPENAQAEAVARFHSQNLR